jgi:hypothetical protein
LSGGKKNVTIKSGRLRVKEFFKEAPINTPMLNNKTLLRSRTGIAKLLSLAVGIAGLMVITGWVLDIGVLKSILPGWISMKLSTAFSFLLSGISLYFIALALEGEFEKAQVVLCITSLLLVLIMGTLFLSSLLEVYTGVEDLFIKDKGNLVKSVAPGRPSVPTMANFMLMVVAAMITILNPGKLQPKLKIIGIIIGTVGALAVAGYIFKAPLLYYYIAGMNSAMAMHTALLFVLLGAGLICL